jgi:hypothetical protein
LCLTRGRFSETRLLGLRFDALLRFDLGGCTSFLGLARSTLGVHPRRQCSGLAALDRRLVKSKVRPGTDPEHQDSRRGQQAGVNTLALLRANGRQLTLVIEHTGVGLRCFARFLFEANAQLRFVALACDPLFFLACSPCFGLPTFFFRQQLGRFFFLSLLCFDRDALALGCLTLKPLLFFLTNTIFFDVHEPAKIEKNGRLFFLGHDDTYITLFRCLRTRAKTSLATQKT